MIPFNIHSLIPQYVIGNTLACRIGRILIGQDKLVDHGESCLGDLVFQLFDPGHFGFHFWKSDRFAKNFLPLFEIYFTHKNDTKSLETFILAQPHTLSRLLITLIKIINSDKLVLLGRKPDIISFVKIAHRTPWSISNRKELSIGFNLHRKNFDKNLIYWI